MSTNLKTIARTHSAMGLFGDNGHYPLGMLKNIGVLDCADITNTSKLCPPGFGSMSVLYLAMALAKEVCRLQAIIDNAATQAEGVQS